jgi:hypothetical protein
VDEDELWYVILRYWDEQYLPSLEMRLLEGCASQETTIAAVACLVTHAPDHLEAIVSQLTSLGSQGQLLEIVASMAHLRDRRAPSGDKLQEATAANMSRLPGPWPEISDAYLDLYNHRPPVLGEAARTILRETTYRSEDVRRLRLAAEVDSSGRTLVDIRCLLDSEDSDIAAEGMKAAAREHMESVVESGLSHKFADVRAVALETLGKASPTPLPESLLSIAADKGFRVKKVLIELLSEKVHPSHEPVLLKLVRDKISNLSHYVGGPDSYPIAREAVKGLSKYEPLSAETIDELYTIGAGTDDPELRSSIFEILASRGGIALQEKILKLAIAPGKTSARRSAAWALLMSRMHLAPEVIEEITTDMLETRIESIAVLLTLIFTATASLEKVRVAAEQLAASSKRRVLLLLMIRELTERDVELAKQVALMLPANHPALLWAFGEELAEAHDRLVSDLGNPGICSEVLFFMKPPEK